MKPTGTIKPKAGQAGRLWKKAAALPRRIWAVGGAALLILGVVWLLSAPAERKAPPSSGAAGLNGSLPETAASPDAGIPETEFAFIQAVRLQPSRPTRLDSLHAEVVVAPTAPGKKLVYTYRWKVNEQVVREATGETLDLSPFKKGDLIAVTVKPHDGTTEGPAVESPLVAVHSVPPSLELKSVRQTRKTGEPIELLLVAAAPDGGEVAFSLEPPVVPGMTIDRRSGKISWVLKPDQKGTVRFVAAAEDDQGTKVTKEFDITTE